MKTKYLLSIVVVLALATSVVYAQHHRTPPDPATRIQHHVDFMTKELGLTTEQQQQVTAMLTSEAANAKNFHDQMRAAHDSLKAAVQKNDAAGIDQAATTIGNLTAQMTSSHAKSHAAFIQTLTPDQQTKLNSMMEKHGHGMGMHGHFGRGGPMGPGGPMSHED
ncbi:MAG: Spy/CpxP family protein refolding chaperone [Acidobacteriia bacterium]|nr:Spy/CpxP family protein refolding chaperone [Terriglobia bacterium]